MKMRGSGEERKASRLSTCQVNGGVDHNAVEPAELRHSASECEVSGTGPPAIAR